MNRKSFIRDTILGIAATLLPEILRPMDVYDGSGAKRFLLDEVGTWKEPEKITYWMFVDGKVHYSLIPMTPDEIREERKIKTQRPMITSKEDKKNVTTFEGLPESAIVFGRRVGNSTRVADHAIQQLFSGYIVHVQDHWQNGRHENANKFLFRTILDRLKSEHPGQRFSFDASKLTIELLP